MHPKAEDARTDPIPQRDMRVPVQGDGIVCGGLQEEVEELDVVMLQPESVGGNMERKGHLKQEVAAVQW